MTAIRTAEGITFDVADTEVELESLPKLLGLADIYWPTKGKVEAYGLTAGSLIAADWRPQSEHYRGNHLIHAVTQAYNNHFPLILSPDHVWLTIAQGFCNHVNNNAEKLRKRFVDHEGKQKIVVRGAGLKGSPFTPWAESVASQAHKMSAAARKLMEHQTEVLQTSDGSALDKFVNELRGRVKGDIVDTIMPTFSTTTLVDHAAMAVTTMASFQNYFEYTYRTCCGIPKVTLRGDEQDWQEVRDRAAKLADYDLEWWTSQLLPVLDKLVESARGEPDQDFWDRIVKLSGGSGGPFLNGWILNLFPYMGKKADRPNRYLNDFLSNWEKRQADEHERIYMMSGANPDDFPGSYAACPFVWEYYEQKFDMEFVGGLVGVTQDQHSYAVEPVTGWAVADVTEAA